MENKTISCPVFNAIAANCPAAQPSNKAMARINALKAAGVDVSNMFAMQSASGAESVATVKDGVIVTLADDDPIFQAIMEQGDVPNRKLFRRWVMAQMFRMMVSRKGLTNSIHSLGYKYMWKMVINELHAQVAMKDHDAENFKLRSLWFNKELLIQMATDYIAEAERYFQTRKVKHCKGVPYIVVDGKDVFVADLKKLLKPAHNYINRLKCVDDSVDTLYALTLAFNNARIDLPSYTKQSQAWCNAYKGAGAFYTMQNMIRFHNCFMFDEEGKQLDKYASLSKLNEYAEGYSRFTSDNGSHGWRMIGVLKKMLKDNNVNIEGKIAEWRK